MKSALLTLVLAVSTFAADNQLTTFNMRNGHFWHELSEAGDYRPAFLMGLMEGWDLRGNTESSVLDSTANALSRSPQFSTDDLAKMISSVYKDPENLSLPVGWVALGCLAVQRGESTKAIVFVALRKHLAHLSEKLATPEGKEEGIPASELDAVKLIAALIKK
jgi:hypothetical protein